MMTNEEPTNLEFAGWGYPLMAKKGHYYSKGQSVSLCGKWLFTGERYQEGPNTGLHCAACTKKLKGSM